LRHAINLITAFTIRESDHFVSKGINTRHIMPNVDSTGFDHRRDGFGFSLFPFAPNPSAMTKALLSQFL